MANQSVYEWWPDNGQGPLFIRSGLGGVAADLDSIPLPANLRDDLRAWNAEYEESKLPLENGGDHAWIQRGIELLAKTRIALKGVGRVVVTEPWWGEEPW